MVAARERKELIIAETDGSRFGIILDVKDDCPARDKFVAAYDHLVEALEMWEDIQLAEKADRERDPNDEMMEWDDAIIEIERERSLDTEIKASARV